MKFRIPIDLKERRRYVCLIARVPRNEIMGMIRRRLKEISGIKGCGIHRFALIPIGDDAFVLRTSEGSIAALLTALLVSKYLDMPSLEVRGVSGTIGKAKELCTVSSPDERRIQS